jgi:hypothetical protein
MPHLPFIDRDERSRFCSECCDTAREWNTVILGHRVPNADAADNKRLAFIHKTEQVGSNTSRRMTFAFIGIVAITTIVALSAAIAQ